jgi:hypothetical protein
MKTIFFLGALVAAVSARTECFEPAGFNVTAALIANGVNVSVILQLSGLAGRSFFSDCSAAIRLCSMPSLGHQDTNGSSVLFLEAYLR